jgi:peptidyl-prolyl cis-trans isomerase C
MTSTFPLPLLALFACSGPPQPSPGGPLPSTATLPSGTLARVGPLAVSHEAVAAVARAEQLTPAAALDREIEDALFANGALQRGVDQFLGVRAALRGTLARAVLESMKRDAGESEPTDAEVAETTARHFIELDRPEGFRVIHAVVRTPENADSALKGRAKSLAERIADHVARASDEADFKSLAESVDRDGLEVLVETLLPVAADGRVLDVDHPADRQTYAQPFARAASQLTRPGQKSGVVATEFGFHVMMLLERTPAQSVSLDERRRLLRSEILTERARQKRKELLASLKSSVETSIERSAETLLATVRVDEHEAP